MKKICPSCKSNKDILEFNSQGKYCKLCHREKNKIWRENNREKDSESKRKYENKRKKNSNSKIKVDKIKVDKKREQLGMPFGTAAGKLRKEYMFYLAKKCGENICYRCGKEIKISKDLSLDHLIDWIDSEDPKRLFFDVENVKFSHLSCNKKALNKIRGVCYRENRRNWVGIVAYNGKSITKSFLTEMEAAEFYDEKMIELFGNDAITNKSLGLI
jgi:hypothetical protein